MNQYQIFKGCDSVGADYAHLCYLELGPCADKKAEIEKIILGNEDFHTPGEQNFLVCQMNDRCEITYISEYTVLVDIGVTVRFV